MTSQIDYALVERSIGFHGAPMQKIWEGERGDSELARGDVKPDFTVYQGRQKHFVFQDRAKRLKLHQFLARKANALFCKPTKAELRLRQQAAETGAKPLEGVVAVTRPFYTFFNDILDKSAQLQRIYSLLNVGDIVYAVVQHRTANGVIAKVLCTGEPNFHYLQDLGGKAFLSSAEMVSAGDRKTVFNQNEHIVCEILELMPDTEKMLLSMRGLHRNPALDPPVTFGLTTLDQYPAAYKALKFNRQHQYNDLLNSSTEFHNPSCLDHLYSQLGLSAKTLYSNMSGARRYPSGEYSNELRQSQASKWAFRSVADGIEHFKEGRHSEAFQCLNKALNIDPHNVEGLVARGALYANSGSFKKAVEDFETALKLNSSHANARKYMGETLVALGRSYEDEDNIEEAKNAYQSCLNIIPTHEEAKNSLDFLWSKASKRLIDTSELTMPALNLKIAEQKRGDKKDGGSRSAKKSKKKKSKARKRDSSSSSSDSSDSSDSSSGSNSSNDSSSSSDSDYSKSKKKRRGRSANRYSKQKSLSPLSKRMVSRDSNAASNARPVMPSTYSYDQSFSYNQPDNYELEMRKFVERSREEDNYDEKVRHFIEEANKYRKESKSNDDKSVSKKRDKRKSRKSKKDSKKKRKEKRSKSSKKDKAESDDLDNMEFREALKILKCLPGLDMTEKLQSVEKSLNLHKEAQKQEDNKWKMMFAKDPSKQATINLQPIPGPSTSKFVPKQYAFPNEDEESDHDLRKHDGRVEHKSNFSTGSTNAYARQLSPEVSNKRDSPNAYSSNRERPAAPKTVLGPVVMDKFGSFRLATVDQPTAPSAHVATPGVPPVLASTQRAKGSCSRSRSPRRRYSSDSRSRSRSPKRRSGSRNFRRRMSRSRSFDRKSSRSGSYSRSRSRSNSNDRRRGGDRRGVRSGGAGNGTYYKPRFNNNFRDNNFRGHNQNRNVGFRGGYRDGYHNQNNSNYRGFNNRNNFNNNNNRGRWVNRGGGGNNRFRNYDNDYRGRRIDRDSRSRSFDDNDRRRSLSNENRPADSGAGSDRRSHSKTAGFGPDAGSANDGRSNSLEATEEFIEKAKKENKEEMLQRNQDIKKNIIL